MRDRSWRTVGLLVAFVAALSWACAEQALSDTYDPCKVPPQISVGFMPNVLLVVDFSGSMQFPAYTDMGDTWSGYGDNSNVSYYGSSYSISYYATGSSYNPSKPYFGLFKYDPDRTAKNDTYYKYNSTGGYFYVSGTAPDGGVTGDTGTFATGISGNFMNWLTATRIDAGLKALIGGKAFGKDSSGNDCDCSQTTDGNCYLAAQGSRRGINAVGVLGNPNAVDAKFYLRPSDWSASQTDWGASDNWNNSGSSYKYPKLHMILSSIGTFRGQLANNDNQEKSGNDKRYYELWKFTLNTTTTVNLTLTGTWTACGDYLRILSYDPSTTDPTIVDGTKIVASDTGSSGGSASISNKSLNAGTYYVMVTPNCWGTSNNYLGTYSLTSDVDLTAVTDDTGKNNGAVINRSVGVLPNARVRVQILQGERTGAVDQNWDRANWGFMYYNGGYDSTSQAGRLMVRCGGATSAAQFAQYVQGQLDSSGAQSTTGYPYPYNGTPTGEALQEAENYFKQSGGINASMFTGTSVDPYYTAVATSSGTVYKPVSCRKSYVILCSDGVWNGDIDPIVPARDMHVNDLRTDVALPGTQTADVYSIFTFGTGDDYTDGTKSLKWTAMYGGFADLSGCGSTGYPYPQSSTSSVNSISSKFPPSTGSCDTTSANACCKEWTSGTGTGSTCTSSGCRGVPDNYYEASSGDQLMDAISQILGKVTQKTASSSAVATVSQQTGEGDIVVRAMFEAMPPDTDTANSGKLLWYGHMEAYWPNSDGQYSFELSPNNTPSTIMCKDKVGDKNCWDAAVPGTIIETFSGIKGPWPSASADNTAFSSISSSAHSWGIYSLSSSAPGRRIITVKGADTTIPRTQYRFNTSNISAAGDSNGDLGLGLTPATMPTATNYADLVNWVLGVDSFTTSTLRKRKDAGNSNAWILGDIVYSTPVVVGPPSLGGTARNTKVIIGGNEVNSVYKTAAATTAGFNKFYLDWRQIPQLKYRDKVVYVGGNDGMLHAFLMAKWCWTGSDITTGAYVTVRGPSNIGSEPDKTKWTHPDIGMELWAYLPSNLLTELQTLADPNYALQTNATCVHRFMVDLAPRSFEVIFQGGASSTTLTNVSSTMSLSSDITLTNAINNWPWHTVLVGGEREGGDMYFALDVTDPYNPIVLWEYSVLKDLVANFDYKAALPAFMKACFDGTDITPGDIQTCQAPQIPSSWWQAQCDKCACTDSGCTSMKTDSSSCESLLRQLVLPDATWKPFLNAGLYGAAKKLPMSWSRPYVGRVGFPSGLQWNPCDPHQTSVPGPTSGGACYPKCTSGDISTLPGVRSLAFIGGGIRIFDPTIKLFDKNWPQFYQDGFASALTDTFMLALDLETGVNVFRYVWPTVFHAAKNAGYTKTQYRSCTGSENTTNCKYRIPYAMSDPVALDVWDMGTWSSGSRANPQIGEDGYTDFVYVGDINGVLYGIKLNFDPLGSVTGDTGFYVDLWKTKPIPLNTSGTQDYASNWFRSRLQPIDAQPAVSIERDTVTDGQHLRVIIGGGKHDDVTGDKTDATDVAKMSLYNLRDAIQQPKLSTFTGTYVQSGSITATTPSLTYAVRSNCEQPSSGTSWNKETDKDQRYRCKGESTDSCTYTVNVEDSDKNVTGTAQWSGCTWQQLDGTNAMGNGNPDCCESSCPPTSGAQPCWQCIFDLIDPGEKVINKPLIAGGVVFFTTFSPLTQSDDVCKAGGVSYLYAFDYMCGTFPDGFRPLQDTAAYTIKTNTSGSQIYGQRASLGLGVASQPVLDSTGNYLIIQNSQGQITKQGVNLLTPVASMKGWKEK